MYGRGNYAPQFGQGLQRPMPPYQQHPAGPAGHPSAPHFQPGHPIQLQPVIQQGAPPHGSAYPHVPPAPPGMSQQGPPVSTSNTGQPYLHPPLTVHGGAPAQHPYSAAQQNFMSGTQNLHHLPPPPPPPPPSMGPPRVPPPPPYTPLPRPPPPTVAGFFPPNFESSTQKSAEAHVPPMAPQPPPLPPSSPPKAPPPPSSWCPSSPEKLSSTPINPADRSPSQSAHGPSSDQVPMSETSGNGTSHIRNSDGTPVSDEDFSLKQSVMVDLPPPPPKPVNEKIVRNIEVLCQFIAKNGPEFEEMARQKESGNPEFNFLVGGDPGSEGYCAHKYYLWMKQKCGLENNLHKGQGQRDLSQRHDDIEMPLQPNSLPNVGTVHSPADSDVDMEDDITQSDKEAGPYNVAEDVKLEPASTGDIFEMQGQENALQHSRDSSPAVNLSPPAKSQADAETEPRKTACLPINIDSSFRLIQNYASDDSSEDDGEPCLQKVKTVVVSPARKSGAISSRDEGYDNVDFKSGMTSEQGLAQSVIVCPESVSTKEQDDSQAVQSGVQETPSTASLPENYEIDDRDGRAEASNSNAAFQGKYASGSSGIDSVSVWKDVKSEAKKNSPSSLKVDEFGRLVKEGASESESDDSPHLRRRGRRDKSQSRSRSRSPSDRRRRRSPRRSPRRRKERRSRSRSWSPKRRRSKSRSPYRPGGDLGGEKLRRGKVQMRECFDFLKGRCYRGASCRYLHHESDKNDSSRHYKSKHQFEAVASSKNSDSHGGNVISRSPQEHNDMKGEKMHQHLDKHGGCDLTSKTYDEKSKAESISNAVGPSVVHQDVEKLVTDVEKCEGFREGDAQGQVESDEPISHLPSGEKHLTSGMPPMYEQVIDHPHAEAYSQPHHTLDDEPQKMDSSTKIDSSNTQKSAIYSHGISVNEPYPGEMSNEPTAPNASTPDCPPQSLQLPPPPLPPQVTNAPQAPNRQVDFNLMAPSVSFPPQSFPVESFPSYQAPLANQQSHYPIPPNLAWSVLPPPQPRPPNVIDQSVPGAPLQFQQGNIPLRNEFSGQLSLGAHPVELPSYSQVGGFQHQMYHLPSSNVPGQPFAGPNVIRDDRYSQFPSQGLVPSSSLVPVVPPQSVPFPGVSTGRNMQSFPGDNMLLGESSKPTSHNHQFPQQRPPPYGPQLTASESMSSRLGGSPSVPGYSSDPLGRDHPSRFLDVGGSRISAHYNPYASTFDQPLSSRFSFTGFTQEREAASGSKYDTSNLGHDPIGHTAGGNGSRQIISSPHSSRAGGHTLPRPGGDQYDPLFDSIEPSSELSKKRASKQDHAADNSDMMLKLSSRHKVLDVVENNMQKEVGAVVAAASLDNDEYGETADAEVGAVENGSPSNPNEDANVAEGEIEIDQVKPEGKSKKSKDSRSMKLFKVAVANFVKEVLKPQWRQGNMSKEVFKTIVKKTVDKVSGAMKNHRLPKSQAKIDHYIDSSRRKLTQLVEGYVSKYKS